MRKLFLIAATTVLSGAAYADNDRPVNVENLPQKAQQFIKEHFAQVDVTYATKDRDIILSEYEVVFDDASRVDFASNGEWKSVERRGTAVPEQIVPQQINDHVKKNYPEAKITKIDRDRNDYDISLSNRMELTFNKNYRLIDIDD